MTATTTEDRPETTPQPLGPNEVPAEALHTHLGRLLRAAETVLRDVDKNSVEIHRHTEHLRAAATATRALLFPPPYVPEDPADAKVMAASEVRPGDRVYTDCCWFVVTEISPDHHLAGTPTTRWRLVRSDRLGRIDAISQDYRFVLTALLPVIVGPNHPPRAES